MLCNCGVSVKYIDRSFCENFIHIDDFFFFLQMKFSVFTDFATKKEPASSDVFFHTKTYRLIVTLLNFSVSYKLTEKTL